MLYSLCFVVGFLSGGFLAIYLWERSFLYGRHSAFQDGRSLAPTPPAPLSAVPQTPTPQQEEEVAIPGPFDEPPSPGGYPGA